jgi:hypothetical protein
MEIGECGFHRNPAIKATPTRSQTPPRFGRFMTPPLTKTTIAGKERTKPVRWKLISRY